MGASLAGDAADDLRVAWWAPVWPVMPLTIWEWCSVGSSLAGDAADDLRVVFGGLQFGR